MKKAACFVMAIAIVCSGTYTAFASASCGEAVATMMETIISWESTGSLDFFNDNEIAKPYLEAFDKAARQLAGRITYQVGNHKVIQEKAVVDLSVCAVDIGQAAGKILLQASYYAALQGIAGYKVDLNQFIGESVSNVITGLPRVTSHTSVYLTMGGDGEWKLDLSDERNLAFLNALAGGGLLPFLEVLASMAGNA